VIAAFVSDRIVESESEMITAARIYDVYTTWAESRGLSPDSKNWFARRLGEQVSFERTMVRRDGDTVRCYEGITIEGLDDE